MEAKKQYCSVCRVKRFWCPQCHLRNKPNKDIMTDDDYAGMSTY